MCHTPRRCVGVVEDTRKEYTVRDSRIGRGDPRDGVQDPRIGRGDPRDGVPDPRMG